MGFSENLQNLRKIKNMSQEQLAEKLDVSRQAVSKWESGNAYPETDKLLAITEIFDCNLDTLVKGKISEDTTGEKKNYERIYNKLSKGISLGVGLILLGVAILLYFCNISNSITGNTELAEQYGILGVISLLICILIAVPTFIILGIEEENYKKKNSKLPNIYSEEEIEEFNKKFTKAIALGVALILLGVIILISLYGIKIVNEESTIPVVVLMLCIAIAVTIFIYFGIQKDKYDIEKYNKENSEENKKREKKVGKISGVIMLSATLIYLATGFIYNMWGTTWVVFALGGVMCAIVGSIFEK